MAAALRLEVATPTRQLVDEPADEVVAPGSLGYFGALPGHAPFLTTLGVGVLSWRVGHEERALAVAGGFAEVRDDRVVVLADVAERPGDIDRERAERARERAAERLAGRTLGADEIDYARAAAALGRSLNRLAVAARSQG